MKTAKPLANALRLEVQTDPAPGQLVNMVRNPNGNMGGWAWSTPVPNSVLVGIKGLTGSPGPVLRYTGAGGSVASYLYTESMPMTASNYAAAYLYVWSTTSYPGSTGYIRIRFEWLNTSLAVIGQSPQSGYISQTASSDQPYGPYQAPAGTAYVRLRIDQYDNTSGTNPANPLGVYFTNVTVAQAANSAALGTTRTNLAPSPSFEGATTGWNPAGGTNNIDSTVPSPPNGTRVLKCTGGVGTTSVGIVTDVASRIVVTATRDYRISIYARAATKARPWNWAVNWFDASGSPIGSTVFLQVNGAETVGAWTRSDALVTAPTNAATMSLQIALSGLDGMNGEVHYLDAVMVEEGTALGSFIVGTVSTTNLGYIVPVPSVNVLGPTHDITVTRSALDIGTLTANIIDSSLDPSQSSLIRPGRYVKLLAYSVPDARWREVFTGQVLRASAEYALTDPDASRRAHIELTATDFTAALANQNRANGVANISDLPYVLEGCGVPWNCNGSGQQIVDPVVVSRNSNASALDQVAITRDSRLGYAWVDRMGVLQAWDRNRISTTVVGSTLDESVYSDINVSYNTDDLINEVNVSYLRIDPSGDPDADSDTVSYGPYQNAASIAQWGVRSSTFTVHGVTETTASLQAYAQAILDANSTPVIRLNSMNLNVDLAADWSGVNAASWYAFADLYDLVRVTCARASITNQQSRITGVTHNISGPDSKWMTTLDFTATTVVASPTYVPDPGTGSGVTLGELLRPVGEVTMWYGAKTAVPAGWLPLDGSTFSGTQYPKLQALLGTTTLPNMADRFPVGAGIKALGSVAGNATVTLAAANLPGVLNLTATGAAAGTGVTENSGQSVAMGVTGGRFSHPVGGGSSSPIDITPPYRALWFIIRAA